MVASIGVIGAAGRMGRLLAEAASRDDEARLGAALLRAGDPRVGQDVSALIGGDARGVACSDALDALAGCDVVIDFTTAATTEAMIGDIAAKGLPIVVGTTGLSASGQSALERAAQTVPVLQASNTSLGVTILKNIVEKVAAALPVQYDIEIVEMHHNRKVDAPSGTALTLGQAAAAGRGVDHDAVADRGRDGHTGPRREGDIGYAVLRGGDVVGEHQVIFAGQGERIEIGHRVTDRSIFARGAITGAKWLVGRAPGLYGMEDVLGL
ncbi:MAG: 4-hydroxy-tetrahydrodipicolinate reductase [Alphaproteobacteria bacterium]|nr:4-hydroxy-tetrahydrodipicolinate reductase [Alphaproteobacteria bacterium]